MLAEGYKKADLPKVEVYRRAVAQHRSTIQRAPNADQWIAIITDDPDFQAECPVLHFHDTVWLQLLATLVWNGSQVLSP